MKRFLVSTHKFDAKRELSLTLTDAAVGLGTPCAPFGNRSGAQGVTRPILSLLFVLVFGLPLLGFSSEFHTGPLFDDFPLTLAPGHRIDAPFYYSEQKDTQHTWAIPPFFSHTQDPGTESEEIDFAYPILTYDRYGRQYRWQIGQLFSFSGGPTQTETARDRFTLFPFYFQQRTSDPSENY